MRLKTNQILHQHHTIPDNLHLNNQTMAKSPNPNTKSTNRTPIRSSKKAPRARLLERSASKRGSLEDDYAESHLIVSGEFNGFKCIKGDGNKVVLVKNKRNRMVKQKTEVEVPDGYLRELDHFDTMLDITDIEGGGDDEELIKYEQTSWTCPKCKMANLNDSSYCSNFIQGKQCMGNPAVVLKTWDGCFAAKVGICSVAFDTLCTPSHTYSRFVHRTRRGSVIRALRKTPLIGARAHAAKLPRVEADPRT